MNVNETNPMCSVPAETATMEDVKEYIQCRLLSMELQQRDLAIYLERKKKSVPASYMRHLALSTQMATTNLEDSAKWLP